VPQTLNSIPFTAANQAFKIAPFFNKGVVYPLIFKVFSLGIHLHLILKIALIAFGQILLPLIT